MSTFVKSITKIHLHHDKCNIIEPTHIVAHHLNKQTIHQQTCAQQLYSYNHNSLMKNGLPRSENQNDLISTIFHWSALTRLKSYVVKTISLAQGLLEV